LLPLLWGRRSYFQRGAALIGVKVVACASSHLDLEESAMSDFCYSQPLLDRILRQAELMDRMMVRVGVDACAAARLDRGMARYEARLACIECASERECLAWLARSPGSASPQPPEFCRNSEFLRSSRLGAR
jgi:hypothetical protein